MKGQNAKKSAAHKALMMEFLRYAVVGGIAFSADFGTFALFRELVFGGSGGSAAIIVSTAAGFLVGIAVNYLLSMKIVFTTEKQQKQGRNLKAVLIFAAVGLVGLLLTEVLQWLGEKTLLPTALGQALEGLKAGLGKYAVKAIVTAIVLVWNYVGRKVFVFREK